MREEVDRPNLVSDWPAAPHPRSTVHDAVLRNRRAWHPDERHTVHPVARWRANSVAALVYDSVALVYMNWSQVRGGRVRYE